jgi:hypothetical protein
VRIQQGVAVDAQQQFIPGQAGADIEGPLSAVGDEVDDARSGSGQPVENRGGVVTGRH